MKNLELKELLNAFLSGSNDWQLNQFFNISGNFLTYHDCTIIEKTKKGLFISRDNISAGDVDIIALFNQLENINVIVKGNTIFINGIQWDGSRTNLNLFL